MMEIRIYTDAQGFAPFDDWLDGLKDRIARAKVRARLLRVEAGNLGDCKPLREGVQELRIDYGPGYRVVVSQQGPVLVLLLCGSEKGGQERAIERAIWYLKDWKQRVPHECTTRQEL